MSDLNNFSNKALLVHVDKHLLDINNSKEEFQDLTKTANISALNTINLTKKNKNIGIKYYIGSGEAEIIQKEVKRFGAQLVVFNIDLSPSQERNLEILFSSRVLDRTGLILDIFSQRAFSHEGKLQVELAQLNYLSTRLVRGWSHLERQKGGIGLRGPGETQLETDRRLIGHRIKSLKKRLDRAHNQKEVNRYARSKGKENVVALVGYTNAGKTTLFNYLTQNNLYAADKPFATLDSVTRKNNMHELKNVLFSDTVGFISNLPTQLIESFKATLDDLSSADLLLHVVDISDKDHRFKVQEVEKILNDLGLSKKPCIRVNNKCDKLDISNLEENSKNSHNQIWLSSTTYKGFESLFDSINFNLKGKITSNWISLSSDLGWLRAELYSSGGVLEERISEQGLIELHLESYQNDLIKLLDVEGFTLINNKQTQEAI